MKDVDLGNGERGIDLNLILSCFLELCTKIGKAKKTKKYLRKTISKRCNNGSQLLHTHVPCIFYSTGINPHLTSSKFWSNESQLLDIRLPCSLCSTGINPHFEFDFYQVMEQ